MFSSGRFLRKAASIHGFKWLLYYQTVAKVSLSPRQIKVANRIDAGSSDNFPNLTHFIRSIQRIEGNPDCFGTAAGSCDRPDCLWREYCLKETQKETAVKNGGFRREKIV